MFQTTCHSVYPDYSSQIPCESPAEFGRYQVHSAVFWCQRDQKGANCGKSRSWADSGAGLSTRLLAAGLILTHYPLRLWQTDAHTDSSVLVHLIQMNWVTGFLAQLWDQQMDLCTLIPQTAHSDDILLVCVKLV